MHAGFFFIICVSVDSLKTQSVYVSSSIFSSVNYGKKPIISHLFPTKSGFMIVYDYRMRVGKRKDVLYVFILVVILSKFPQLWQK